MPQPEKAPILSLEEREELKKSALAVMERVPGKWKFIEGCLSLIAELEIKEAVIAQLGENKLRLPPKQENEG